LYRPFKGLVFSLVEKDKSYTNFLYVKQALAEIAITVPPETPKFFPRAMSYFLKYPEMGYVDEPVQNGFFVVLSNASHGAEILRSVPLQVQVDTSVEY